MVAVGRSMAASSSSGGRSESEKEKTKIRERQRRAITTKIFHGLRKHGGYNLSPRADINEVLRQLAKEAGWIIDPDGTTYRPKAMNCCPVCGAAITSATQTPTPTSSIVIGGGGECSTTASPRCISVGDPMTTMSNVGGGPYFSSDGSGGFGDIPLALYMYGGIPTSSTAGGCGGTAAKAPYQQQQVCLREARASNQNTPVGSPLRRTN